MLWKEFKILKFHKLSIITILEPFTDNSQPNICRIHLMMDEATCNPNGRIWIFWTQDVGYRVLEYDDEQIICEHKYVEHPSTFLIIHLCKILRSFKKTFVGQVTAICWY